MEVKTVFAAVSQVQRELSAKGIGKNQRNDFDKYQFRGIDDVYNALGPVLAGVGLVVYPAVTNRETIERTSQKGGVMLHVILDVTYNFVGPDGSTFAVPVIGEAMDRGDKAINKAMSAAYKLACFQVFCIPIEGQDSERDSPEVGKSETVSTEQRDALLQQIDAAGLTAEKFCTGYAVDAVGNLPADKFDAAMRVLENRAEKRRAAQ